MVRSRPKTVTEAVVKLLAENEEKSKEIRKLKEENKQLERRLMAVEKNLNRFSRIIRESHKRQNYLRERHDTLANQVASIKTRK